ncbi:hypothetical protein JJB09_01940 [Rhizobium sp. KVB221]|uniref:Uncharacterized protein n=1 Tax=Rhizobium setariae TaxID=2801340 RepID=A0A937CN54_9HYPH|nr:DUF6101 family protein [Rhizobium setariae]MBL0370778.1 hypothetical protein [Rhizobium setariae]
MQNTVMQPSWASKILRLDPGLFPQQLTYRIDNSTEVVSITIDERGAVMRRNLPASGLPLTVALPSRVFAGVAARAIDHGNGEVTVTLELHHTDPGLCIPLLVAHDLFDVAADWRSWSEAYGIPMLMVEADGIARPLDEHLLTAGSKPPKPRRRHSYFADRRPRFLVRRKSGTLGIRMKLEGKEIFPLD